ncbi:hypothetical protein [Streptomyces sp. NPDC096311]|uniref:hypothetical protein n=1 Tax=Streptomyces sp. NPDC096311 TaxID=3366083 RepID=UPI0037F670CD
MPEPIDTSSDPDVGAQRAEGLELALLLVLEKLTPAERAAYVLKEHRRLLEAFVAAARQGDVASLEALLTPGAVSPSDGGLRGAARVPVLGRARVANPSTAFPRFWGEVEVRFVEANGRSGVLLCRGGRPTTFMTVAASTEGVHRVMWVCNPNKIAAFLDSPSRYETVLGV